MVTNTIELYKAEWCGACKSFKQTWEGIKPILNQNGIKTIVYDHGNDEAIMKERNISSFPTLFYYDSNGDKSQIYDRSVDSILHTAGIKMTGGGNGNEMYYQKYLKYKNKYFDLKQGQIIEGGGFGGKTVAKPSQKANDDTQKIIEKYLPQYTSTKKVAKEYKNLLKDFKGLIKSLKGVVPSSSKKFFKDETKLFKDPKFLGIVVREVQFFDTKLKDELQQLINFCYTVDHSKEIPESIKLFILAKYLVEEHLLAIDGFDKKQATDLSPQQKEENAIKEKKHRCHAFAIVVVMVILFHTYSNIVKKLDALEAFIMIVLNTQENASKLAKASNNIDQLNKIREGKQLLKAEESI